VEDGRRRRAGAGDRRIDPAHHIECRAGGIVTTTVYEQGSAVCLELLDAMRNYISATILWWVTISQVLKPLDGERSLVAALLL
jgi:hypothetical protein